MSKAVDNKKSHISEGVIERFVLDRTGLDQAVIDDIEEHARNCRLCAEKLERLNAFAQGLAAHLDNGPTDRDKAFALSVLSSLRRALPERGLERMTPEERVIGAYAEVMAPDRPALPARFLRFVRRNPVRSSVGVAIFGAMLLYSANLFINVKDKNPAFAEIRKNVLYVYNRETHLLWERGVPGLPDWNTNLPFRRDEPHRFLLLSDLRGNGTNQLLLTGRSDKGEYTQDTLYCFNGKGELNWKTGVGLMPSFGSIGETHHARPSIMDFTIFRPTATSRARLFVLANEEPFSPSKVFEVDPETGNLLQSFYNRGGAQVLRHHDMDGDGVEELIVGGINDGYDRAFLAVFDPAKVAGYGPVPREFAPVQANPGTEKYYLLFPFSPLPPETRWTLYNAVVDLVVTGTHEVNIDVREWHVDQPNQDGIGCRIFFSVAQSMAVNGVTPDDRMLQLSEKYSRDGILKKPITREAIDALKDSVMYWNGSRFVYSPTPNEFYRSAR
jgi:hypothetical protein